jgi:hypothetical protein
MSLIFVTADLTNKDTFFTNLFWKSVDSNHAEGGIFALRFAFCASDLPSSDYRKIMNSRPVYYSTFQHFWGATN